MARTEHLAPHAANFPAGATAVLLLAVALGWGCSGIPADVDYPDDLPDEDPHLLTPEGREDPSVSLGSMKIRPELCQGIDTHTITQPINQEDFTRFLEAQGVRIAPKKARGNLYWYDFPVGPDEPNAFVRLRLAVLDSPQAAAKDLHESLLYHGPGWWGVRRSNLAILAPKASLSEALAFAVKYKLPCWGMFTYTGNDDAYVVPGPYMEL